MLAAGLVVTEDFTEVNRKMNEFCGDNYVGHPDMDMGFVLDPAKQQLVTEMGGLYPRSMMISKSSSKKFEGWLVGCIGYRDQFGYLYHMKFIYDLADPKFLGHPMEFDATPNTQITGSFKQWWAAIDNPGEVKQGR